MRQRISFLMGQAGLSLILVALGTVPAGAQSYPSAQASGQGSPQSYPPVSTFCPFPTGYCPFPTGYCALPAAPCASPMGSPQGNYASGQGGYPSAPCATSNLGPKPYPAPTFYTPIPLGVPPESFPSSQAVVAAKAKPQAGRVKTR